MDRSFMEQYYLNMYDDAIGEAVKGREEFFDCQYTHTRLEETLNQMMGGNDSVLWKQYEECMMEQVRLETIMCRASYLQGAADRERMLR